MATASLACGGVQLLASLKTLYDAGSEVDLNLFGTGGASIKCHSIVAAANSSYIKECIGKGGPADVTEQAGVDTTYCVRIDDVSRAVLKQIVDYFYTGHINIDEDNVEKMMLLGKNLLSTGLVSTCEVFMKTIISAKNYQKYLLFGETHSLQKVINVCKSFLADDIDFVFKANLVPEMSLKDLLWILADDHCNIKNEDDILSVALSWLKSNAENFQNDELLDVTESLLNCVRFELCSAEKLYEVLAESPKSLRAVESLLHKKCLMQIYWVQASEKGMALINSQYTPKPRLNIKVCLLIMI